MTYNLRKNTKGAGAPLETEAQNSICDYLAYNKKIMFWRQNNIPVSSDGVFRAMPKHSKRGVPDIIVILPPDGRFMGLEVKRKGGVVSDHQKQFRAELERMGGTYHVVYSIDDVVALGL